METTQKEPGEYKVWGGKKKITRPRSRSKSAGHQVLLEDKIVRSVLQNESSPAMDDGIQGSRELEGK